MRKKSLAIFFVALPVAACVTTIDRPGSSSPASSLPATQAPAAPGYETSRPAAGQAPLVLAPVPDSQIADFAARHALSVASLTESDEALLNRMPNQPQAGSIHEAALVLGIVKSFNPVNNAGNTFSESDINAAQTTSRDTEKPSEPTGKGLEGAALARGVDLPGALEVNPFLQSAAVVRMIGLAADKGGNSEAFNKRLRAAIAKQTGEWRTLSERYGSDTATAAVSTSALNQPVASPSASPEPGTPEVSKILEGNAGVSDLHSSDLVINEAVKLANQGEFDKAIETVRRVQKDSPLRKLSEEKAMEFANSAVREMRRKAAHAFSAANQANDSGTKSSYLEKAKTILEEALLKYPDADQVGTVRENLTVINRDLERIRASSAQRK